MFNMIVKMLGITGLYTVLTGAVWYWTKEKSLTKLQKLMIGIIYGISSVLSTHFGVIYDNMVLNVRDIGPLAAGLFFSPVSGIIAGLMGGIERYIAGTYFGVGTYTRIACSISTCLAGFVAMAMNMKMFKGKKPSPFYAFFMGAVMEVFHMYVVFITHRSDMRMAFHVVQTCSVPMIIFTGLGLAFSAILLQVVTGEWRNPFVKQEEEAVPVSQKFQRWLFIITSLVITGNFVFSYALQTQSAYQNTKNVLEQDAERIKLALSDGHGVIAMDKGVMYSVLINGGVVSNGYQEGRQMSGNEYADIKNHLGKTYGGAFFGNESLICVEKLDEKHVLAVVMTEEEAYWYRDAEAYEIAFADILLFTVIYAMIAFLVNQIVVNNIRLINNSLGKITNGDLNEMVTVRSSSEFASLSDDINQTVFTLKGYIAAAEKRIEQELILARTIQESALPKNFVFPGRDEFKIYATMDPAKEVGGDFYDFFFVGRDKIALVIADVSGKGIPASLFMMRSKTAIRSFAESGGSPEEILIKANSDLCEGNDAEMFVTAWIGIVDLTTGMMRCANAGHEYPTICHANGEYELIKDKHSLALAAMPNTKPKEYEVQLQPGDRIFVYTDGIPEAINETEEQFGTDRMLEVLNKGKTKALPELLAYMAAQIDEFKGNADQFDDITMLGFELVNKLETE